jgi:hypothetical protein
MRPPIMSRRPIKPPATPPAIAPTFGPSSSFLIVTGAEEEVGVDDGVRVTTRVITPPLSVII